jgi:hypothetical protein
MAGWLDGYLALILREIREGVNPTSDQTGGRTKGHGGRSGVTPTARSLPFGADAGFAPGVIVDCKAFRLSGQDPLAVRASKKLRNDELLVTTFAGTVLRTHLDRVPVAKLYPGYCAAKPISPHAKVKKLVAEFQKILDHRGIVLSDPVGALANLQLGHAHEMAGDSAEAKAAYKDSLTLWKDATPTSPS